MTDDDKAEEGGDVPAGGATWREAPGLALRGLCMGTADVVPGVSGGTMALILGIYSRWIASIKSLDSDALVLAARGRVGEARDRVHWRFLGAVALGQALGITLFTKGIPLPELASSHRELIYALFFGLIVGSVFILGRQLREAGWTRARVAAGALGIVFGLLVVNLVRVAASPEWSESPWFVFLCGCVSICAMVLPGISGSFVLLILHKYEYVLGGLGQFILPTGDGGRMAPFLEIVLPFGAGCIVGLLAFSRLIGWLLARARQATLSFMSGLMVGSLYVIWPYQDVESITVRGKQKVIGSTPILPEALDAELAGVVLLALLGCFGVIALEVLARKRSAPC